MSDERTIAEGDPQAVMAAVAEYYRRREDDPDCSKEFESFTCWDFTQTLQYTVTVIGGPGSELVLRVFDEDGEMLGWAETGFLAS